MASSSSSPAAPRNPFSPPPEPKSRLGYYRLISPQCGLRVSPLCLGAMNFGTAWKGIMGEITKDTAFNMLEKFYDQGGNFIDTANNYQEGESESWIGEWMEKTGRRDEFVIATKFSSPYKIGTSKPETIHSNFTGNGRKSLHTSVEASLKKLRTTYIDLLYIHWWDYTTPVEELMQGLHHLVASGKVLYLGVSDTPAWIVSKANTYARLMGLTPFVVYQGKWSITDRDFERDIIPMCKVEGMGLAPWGVLGRGLFKSDEELKKMEEESDQGRQMGREKGIQATRAIVKVMEKFAKQKNTNVAGIALAYVLNKVPYVFPIVGGRKLEHLQGNIEALQVSLTDEEMKELEAASPIDLGFPHNFVGTHPANNFILGLSSKYDWVPEVKPIKYLENKK